MLEPYNEEVAAEADSDDDGNTPSRAMGQECQHARNARWFHKHALAVQYSSDTSGYGLFAKADLKPSDRFFAKGPFFHTLSEMQEWMKTLPDHLVKHVSTRVVRLDIAMPGGGRWGGEPDGEEKSTIYKVITNPIGFINNYTQLGKANCKLVWISGGALDEHCLAVQLTAKVAKGKQLLLNYGPLHQCGASRKRKTEAGRRPARKRERRAERHASEAGEKS